MADIRVSAASGKKGGRPRLAQPKERVSFRIPADVYDIYDRAERAGGMKATKAMERAVTLQAQAIERAFRHKKPA